MQTPLKPFIIIAASAALMILVTCLPDLHAICGVSTNPTLGADGCFTTSEPARSRGDSHRVETRFCRNVAKDFRIGGWHTVVFRIG